MLYEVISNYKRITNTHYYGEYFTLYDIELNRPHREEHSEASMCCEH